MIGVGVIGAGYWGPNLIRNFAAADDCSLVAVCDRSQERLAGIERGYPLAKRVSRVEDLLDDDGIDAIAIATPVAAISNWRAHACRAVRAFLLKNHWRARCQSVKPSSIWRVRRIWC